MRRKIAPVTLLYGTISDELHVYLVSDGTNDRWVWTVWCPVHDAVIARGSADSEQLAEESGDAVANLLEGV